MNCIINPLNCAKSLYLTVNEDIRNPRPIANSAFCTSSVGKSNDHAVKLNAYSFVVRKYTQKHANTKACIANVIKLEIQTATGGISLGKYTFPYKLEFCCNVPEDEPYVWAK